MSKRSGEGSIPSGRAPTEGLENQALRPGATEQVGGACSAFGPKRPEEGQVVEMFGSYQGGVRRWHPANVVYVGPTSFQACLYGNDTGEGLWWAGYEGCGVRWRWPLGATAGKNGVPELSAQPDPQEIPVRRCKGAPGCECGAVLGPVSEVPGELCAHCENLARELQRLTEETEEVFIDCDRCLPDRMPKSGKLCGRCQGEEKRRARSARNEAGESSLVAKASLQVLIRAGVMTADEAQAVQCSADYVFRAVSSEVMHLQPMQAVVLMSLLRDAAEANIARNREPAASALAMGRSA